MHEGYKWTTGPCPTVPQSYIHPRMLKTPPTCLVPEAPMAEPGRLPCFGAPVRGTHLLSMEGPPPPKDMEGQEGCSRQVALGQTDRQTDPPNLGVSKAVAPEPFPPSPPPPLRDAPRPCALPGWGMVGSSTGWHCHPPCPRARTGSRRVLVCVHPPRNQARAPWLLL